MERAFCLAVSVHGKPGHSRLSAVFISLQLLGKYPIAQGAGLKPQPRQTVNRWCESYQNKCVWVCGPEPEILAIP